jgi:hypothetical protein
MPALPDVSDLRALQSAFAASLLQRDVTVSMRAAVHRNNVRASLSAALAARFPVVARLVGAEFFRALALQFIEQQPPRSPVLAEYGARFGDFLDAFEPAREVPYLADVARLEWARHLAWHAADAAVLPIERLAAVAPDRLESVRLGFHPATAIVASIWPVVSIWTTNAIDREVRPLGADAGSECALVTRPGLEVLVDRAPAGTDLLVASLLAGAGLGAAVDAATSVAEFDTAAALSLLFTAGAVTSLAVGSVELS